MGTASGPDDTALEAVEIFGSAETSDPARYAAVEQLLIDIPQEFQFFQAVRLFERLHPDRAPVGRFVSPSKEVLRFCAHASTPFPASQIQRVEWPEDGAPRVVINFMGLAGPSGLLPLYYTELIMDRVRQKDTALRDFLDMFNHRMVSMFYAAWEKYRFAIAYERREADTFSQHLMDLIGLGTKGLSGRLDIRDHSLLYYAGLLSLRPRSAAALERILWDYFDVPVQVEQFVGSWRKLEESNICRFEAFWEGDTNPSEQLGGGAIVGDAIWNQQAGVRIKLGPLAMAEYMDFLPSGTAHQPLKSFAKFISRGEIDFEVQLILRKEDVPPCELASEQAAPRLGWTSWAATQPARADADDTIFSIS